MLNVSYDMMLEAQLYIQHKPEVYKLKCWAD